MAHGFTGNMNEAERKKLVKAYSRFKKHDPFKEYHVGSVCIKNGIRYVLVFKRKNHNYWQPTREQSKFTIFGLEVDGENEEW